MDNVLNPGFRVIFIALLLAFASGVAADACPHVNAESGFVAHYDVRIADTHNTTTMVKVKDWTAYYGAGQSHVELWHRLPAGHAQLYRAFPRYERSILYTISALDLKGRPSHWRRVANLVDTRQLRVVETHATACGPLEQLEGILGRFHVEASWYPQRHLLEGIVFAPTKTDSPAATRRYRLRSAEGAQAANEMMDRWRAYRSTDFADIGDNESDPILAKMMRSDFVGHSRRGAHKDGKRDRRVHDEQENQPAPLSARLRQ